MSKVIFLSDYAGYSPSNGGKPFCKFLPMMVLDEVRMERVQKGYLILDVEKDKETIEQLKKFPTFNKDYKIVERLPLSTNTGSVINGVVTQSARDDKAIKDVLEKQLKEKFKRYYELEAKLLTKSGEYKKTADVTEELVQEFEKLKSELE